MLSGSGDRANHEELIEGQLTLVPVTAFETKLPFDIEGREELGMQQAVAHSGRRRFQQVEAQPGESLPLVPPTRLQGIGRVLNDGRQDMFAGWSQPRFVQRRHGNFHRGRSGIFAVLGVVVGPLEVVQ